VDVYSARCYPLMETNWAVKLETEW
jgi:hypothetical protein